MVRKLVGKNGMSKTGQLKVGLWQKILEDFYFSKYIFQFSILNYCIHYMTTINYLLRLIYCQLKGNKVMKGNSKLELILLFLLCKMLQTCKIIVNSHKKVFVEPTFFFLNNLFLYLAIDTVFHPSGIIQNGRGKKFLQNHMFKDVLIT